MFNYLVDIVYGFIQTTILIKNKPSICAGLEILRIQFNCLGEVLNSIFRVML